MQHTHALLSMSMQMGYPVLLWWCWPSCNHISQSVYDKAPPMCVCPPFTWCALWRILRPSPLCLHTASNQKLEVGKDWEQGYRYSIMRLYCC